MSPNPNSPEAERVQPSQQIADNRTQSAPLQSAPLQDQQRNEVAGTTQKAAISSPVESKDQAGQPQNAPSAVAPSAVPPTTEAASGTEVPATRAEEVAKMRLQSKRLAPPPKPIFQFGKGIVLVCSCALWFSQPQFIVIIGQVKPGYLYLRTHCYGLQCPSSLGPPIGANGARLITPEPLVWLACARQHACPLIEFPVRYLQLKICFPATLHCSRKPMKPKRKRTRS